jgi:hypothetical protein
MAMNYVGNLYVNMNGRAGPPPGWQLRYWLLVLGVDDGFYNVLWVGGNGCIEFERLNSAGFLRRFHSPESPSAWTNWKVVV